MGWYLVHLKHGPRLTARHRTFQAMLWDERPARNKGQRGKIFHFRATDGGHCYCFSPRAAEQYSALVRFWDGYLCFTPATWIRDRPYRIRRPGSRFDGMVGSTA